MDSHRKQHDLAEYEALRSCANRAMWAIDLQIRRLRQSVEESKEDHGFVLQPVSDAEFLILSLSRLLAVSKLVNTYLSSSLNPEIAAFETELPDLKPARNVIAHIDEYLVGKGRNNALAVREIETTIFSSDVLVFSGFEFELNRTRRVAECLFHAVESHTELLARKDMV